MAKVIIRHIPDKNPPITDSDLKVDTEQIVVIGPTCRSCVFAVCDVEDTEHCLRYHQNIAKHDAKDFTTKAATFIKVHKCQPGKYVLMVE